MAQGYSRRCRETCCPRGTFCESKQPKRYQGYLAAMSTIVQSEPGSFEEVVKHQVWKDAMHEEYVEISLGKNQLGAEIHYQEFETPWIY